MGNAYKAIVIAGLLFLIINPALSAQSRDSLWLPFKFLEGKWTGTSEGMPGTGKYERSYNFIFNGRYLEIRNKSVYPPQEQNPKGEVHEDIGYLSFDSRRKKFVLRQFHIEGFVNQYILSGKTDSSFTFLTENIENIPPGFKARETLIITSQNEFYETFEIAEPGKDFEIYSKAFLTRTVE